MADNRTIGQMVADSRRYERMKINAKRPKLCDECGIYRADPPSKLCPGCQAYREHQT